MPSFQGVVGKVQDRRFAARAGNTAGIASYLVLSFVGRPAFVGRVVPALLVRRHVRRALEQFSTSGRRRKRTRILVSTGAIAALALGGSARRRRTEVGP
jgi:hypothetical protein